MEFFAGYEVCRTEKTKNTLSVNMQYRTGFPCTVAPVRYPGVKPETDIPVEPGYTRFRDGTDCVGGEPNIRLRDFFRTDVNFTTEKKRKHGSLIRQFSILNVTARDNPYNIYRYDDRYRAFIPVPFLPSFPVRREF